MAKEITKSTYNLSKQLYIEHPELQSRLTKENETIVDAILFKKIPEIFFETKPDSGEFIKVYGREDNKRCW